MARQAVDEALHELPPGHKQVVKLAYFGGLTNREIAQEVGLSVSEVRRVLRASLASVGAHFERGRAKGRRGIQDLLMLPWWRNVVDSAQKAPWPAFDHVVQTCIVAVMTAAAAALLVTHQAPVHAGHVHKPAHVTATGSVGSNLQSHSATFGASVRASQPAPVTAPPRDSGAVSAATATLESQVPLSVSLAVPPVPPVVLPRSPAQSLPQLPFGA